MMEEGTAEEHRTHSDGERIVREQSTGNHRRCHRSKGGDVSPPEPLQNAKMREMKMGDSLHLVLALEAPAYRNRVRVNAVRLMKKVSEPSPATEEVGEEESNDVPTYHAVIRRHRSEKTPAIASLYSQKCREADRATKKKKKVASWTPALGFTAVVIEEMDDAMWTSHQKPMRRPKRKLKKSSKLVIGEENREENPKSSKLVIGEENREQNPSGCDGISKQSLESFANMLDNFRYVGNSRLQEPLDIAATASCATFSSTFNVKSASRNCIRAASRCLEESMLRKKSPNLAVSIGTTPFKHRYNITTSFSCNNTTIQNSSSSATANPPLIAGEQDEACWDLPASAPQKMKKRRKAAQVQAPCPALSHESASQRTKAQRKTTLLPMADEGGRLPKSVRCKRSETMTKEDKMQDAYHRVSPESTWVPPNSPHELLQEDHAFDPWRVLVICMLLNQTTGEQVKNILRRVFLLCPTAEAAAQVPLKELRTLIESLGLQNKRARDIRKLSHQYLKDGWTHVTQLHGVGKYAADAYAIFCAGRPEDVVPSDHKLVKYWEYVVQWRHEQRQLAVGFNC